MANKKYKLTKEVKEYNGVKLYRIEALVDFCNVRKGDKGGFIEKEENLDNNTSGNAWVYEDASVYGNARVYENAEVYGNARVYENAKVYEDAWVFGNARVYGNAMVYGGAMVYEDAKVYGDTKVYEDAWVYGNAKVYGDVYGNTIKPNKTKEGRKVKVKLSGGEVVEGTVVEG